jgi:parvulin-like peptidyl-prolyl isomerase
MKASHILVKQLFEAQDLLKALSEEKSFESLARIYSLCSSAELGGWLGDLSKNKVDPEFLKALSMLKPNEISSPVRTKFGYHLIRREED